MSDDHNTSGIGENPEGDIRPDFLQGTQPSSSVKYDAHTSVSVWTTLGEVCGAHLRRQFRHDRNNDTWYEWRDGNHWVAIRNTTIITDALHNDRLRIAADLGDQGQDDLRDLLVDDKKPGEGRAAAAGANGGQGCAGRSPGRSRHLLSIRWLPHLGSWMSGTAKSSLTTRSFTTL